LKTYLHYIWHLLKQAWLEDKKVNYQGLCLVCSSAILGSAIILMCFTPNVLYIFLIIPAGLIGYLPIIHKALKSSLSSYQEWKA